MMMISNNLTFPLEIPGSGRETPVASSITSMPTGQVDVSPARGALAGSSKSASVSHTGRSWIEGKRLFETKLSFVDVFVCGCVCYEKTHLLYGFHWK